MAVKNSHKKWPLLTAIQLALEDMFILFLSVTITENIFFLNPNLPKNNCPKLSLKTLTDTQTSLDMGILDQTILPSER